MKLLTAFLLTLPLLGQVTIDVGTITVPTEVAASVNQWRRAQAKASTATTADVNAAVTAIPLASTADIAVGDHLMIEDEELAVTAKNGAGVQVTRGVLGTDAAPHATGSQVQVLKFATPIALVKLGIIKPAIIRIIQSTPTDGIKTELVVIDKAKAAIAAIENGAVD